MVIKFHLFSDYKYIAFQRLPSYLINDAYPSRENYRSMAFDTQGNLLVFFDKYQVAWGAAGSQEVKILLEDIQNLLKIKP